MDWEKQFKEGTFINGDCLEYMKQMPDNIADLAIVDPPYGIGKRLTSGGAGGGWENMVKSEAEKWDIQPDDKYFKELFRISANQIIWGGNYFNLPKCEMPICWDKVRPNQKNISEWEYAWTSFCGRARLFKYCANGGFILKEKRIHPTQKPVQLYKWLLKNYAKPTDKIIDTHVGSGSSIIAFEDFGCEYIGFERDFDYFSAASKRIAQHKAQLTLNLNTN